MGLFDKNYEKSADELYEDVKKYLSPKDGKKHIVLLNTMTKVTTNGRECENKYTLQVNSIIEGMQKDGYEILDIKIVTGNQVIADATLIRTLVTYM